jgi:hypothetical protein
VRKSRREKEKEAAEAKQKEEDERAAQAYAEFLDEFEGEGAGATKTSQFVQSGNAQAYAPANTLLSEPTAPRQRLPIFDDTVSKQFTQVPCLVSQHQLFRMHKKLQSPRANAPWMLFFRKLKGMVLAALYLPPSSHIKTYFRDQAHREAKFSRNSLCPVCHLIESHCFRQHTVKADQLPPWPLMMVRVEAGTEAMPR